MKVELEEQDLLMIEKYKNDVDHHMIKIAVNGKTEAITFKVVDEDKANVFLGSLIARKQTEFEEATGIHVESIQFKPIKGDAEHLTNLLKEALKCIED